MRLHASVVLVNKVRPEGGHMLIGIVVAIVATTVLAIPVLLFVWLVAGTIGHIIPESPLAACGGGMSATAFFFTGRTAEGGLHHAISRSIDRLFGGVR